MWTNNFQMYKLDLEKAEEPEMKLPTSAGSSKKQESPRKTSTSVLLSTQKPLTVWITTNCGKFLKIWKYQTTLPVSWETLCASRSNNLNQTWNNGLVQNWERSTTRLYIATLLIWLPGGSAGKEFACDVRDLSLLPGLGRCPGEGNGYPSILAWRISWTV